MTQTKGNGQEKSKQTSQKTKKKLVISIDKSKI